MSNQPLILMWCPSCEDEIGLPDCTDVNGRGLLCTECGTGVEEIPKFEITIQRTIRGFGYAEFEDTYEQKCSIQDSSVVPKLWLGVVNTGPNLKPSNQEIMARMHLSIQQVEALIPILQHFVDNESIANWESTPIIKTCSCSRMYDLVSWRTLSDPKYQAIISNDGERLEIREQRLCSCGDRILISLSPNGQKIYNLDKDLNEYVAQDLGAPDKEFQTSVEQYFKEAAEERS